MIIITAVGVEQDHGGSPQSDDPDSAASQGEKPAVTGGERRERPKLLERKGAKLVTGIIRI